MADFDAQQPVRAIATQFTTEVANAAGTTINPAEDYAQGSTTSGQNGVLLQGAVTTSAPSYTTGTTNPLSMDINGNLRVTFAASSETNVNLNQVGGTAIALGQTTMSASLPVAIASNQSTLNTSDLADGTTGSTVPSTAILAGADVVSSAPTLTAGNLSSLYVTTAGRLIVDGSQVTQPVSGTITANQGTSPWVVSLASTTITGTVAVTQSTTPWVTSGNLTNNNAAPAANNIGVLPAVASTAAPTYTTGDQVLLSTDLSGNLRVTATSVALQNVNVTQWDSVALGAPSTYGTAPGAVNVIGVNAFVTNTVAENLTQVGGTAIALGQTTMSASLPVAIASNQSTLNTSDAADGPVAAGTAATKSILIGGQYNTTLPTLTNGQQAAIQVDNNGRLLVDTGGLSQTFTYVDNSSVATNASVTQTVSGPINFDGVHVTASGEVKIVVAYGVSGSEATKWVGFTSASNKNFDWFPQDTIVIPSGSDVKVTMTNRDTAAMDIYSTVVNH